MLQVPWRLARLRTRGLVRLAFGQLLGDQFLRLSGRFDLAQARLQAGYDVSAPLRRRLSRRNGHLDATGRMSNET